MLVAFFRARDRHRFEVGARTLDDARARGGQGIDGGLDRRVDIDRRPPPSSPPPSRDSRQRRYGAVEAAAARRDEWMLMTGPRWPCCSAGSCRCWSSRRRGGRYRVSEGEADGTGKSAPDSAAGRHEGVDEGAGRPVVAQHAVRPRSSPRTGGHRRRRPAALGPLSLPLLGRDEGSMPMRVPVVPS